VAKGVKQTYGVGGWGLAINADIDDKQKEAAWTFIKWVESKDVVKKRTLAGGAPTQAWVFDDPEVKAKYAYVDKLKSAFDSLKPRPVTPYYGQMSADAIQPNFGAAVTRAKTPDQAIKDMADQLRKIAKG
jgi:ABC-type glycerol-3-phosphate transport system substrate-binding protein